MGSRATLHPCVALGRALPNTAARSHQMSRAGQALRGFDFVMGDSPGTLKTLASIWSLLRTKGPIWVIPRAEALPCALPPPRLPAAARFDHMVQMRLLSTLPPRPRLLPSSNRARRAHWPLPLSCHTVTRPIAATCSAAPHPTLLPPCQRVGPTSRVAAAPSWRSDSPSRRELQPRRRVQPRRELQPLLLCAQCPPPAASPRLCGCSPPLAASCRGAAPAAGSGGCCCWAPSAAHSLPGSHAIQKAALRLEPRLRLEPCLGLEGEAAARAQGVLGHAPKALGEGL